MPNTGSILPMKIDVRCESVGSHSTCAMSTSSASPRAKSLPVRGVKLMLADTSAVGVSAERSVTLTSLSTKPGAPRELMLS